MVLNLYVHLKHAATPWSCVSKPKAQDPELHHRSEPVPGIYLQDGNGHFLVAMKPKKGSTPDTSLFVPRDGFDSKDRSKCYEAVPSRPSLLRQGSGHSSVFNMDSIASESTSTSSLDRALTGSISPIDICGYRYVDDAFTNSNVRH